MDTARECTLGAHLKILLMLEIGDQRIASSSLLVLCSERCLCRITTLLNTWPITMEAHFSPKVIQTTKKSSQWDDPRVLGPCRVAAKVQVSILDASNANQWHCCAAKLVKISSASSSLHVEHKVNLAPSQSDVGVSYCVAMGSTRHCHLS